MIWLIFGSVVPSFLVSLAAAFFVRRRAAAWGLVDQPGHRKVHRQPTPMGGGLAIWAGVVLPLALGQVALWMAVSENGFLQRPLSSTPLWSFVAPHLPGLLRQTPKLWTLLGGATAMMVLGLVDDRRGLDWRLRIALQTAIAVVMVGQGWRLTLFLEAPLITAPLSVLWIVGLVNTFNMLDNMDGLSAGVAAIAAGILAAVILTAPDPITHGPQLFVGGFLLVLLGALVGFLWHNRPPAKLFMGDAGSYFVGFCLATATISATFAGEGLPRHAILAPLCVLAVPLYDTITVVFIRLREGRSPMQGDTNHISHRLVALGLSQPQAVLVVYGATAVCGLAALMLHRVESGGAVIILAVITSVLVAVAIVELKARSRRDAIDTAEVHETK